ncbi:PREDICTED: uncharacterized protein LOC101309926 [Fragaria vesca subsp. vesca]
MVGSLMYLTVTRPDLMFVGNLVSRYMENPTELHMQAIKRILRYVKGTVELGISCISDVVNGEELVAFSDSDYVGDIDDRKSTSGYVFMLSNGEVAWSPRKQRVVTLSTTKPATTSSTGYAGTSSLSLSTTSSTISQAFNFSVLEFQVRSPPWDNQPKTGRGDNRGLAVVVLDALSRRQWVREEDLAKDLKLHSKQLRRTLRFFEEEKLVTRDHRKETAKGAKIFSAAVAATADGQQHTKEGEEKIKLHTHSYCCLDYAQIYDVVRYRLHHMRKKLKDELEDKNTVQEYVCPNCGKRFLLIGSFCSIYCSKDKFADFV